MARCDIDDCPRERYGKKPWCEKHYRRHLRTGSTDRKTPEHGVRGRCAVAICKRTASSRGWCHGHYQRWRNTGDVQAHIPLDRRKQPALCSVDICGRTTHASGLCQAHYRRKLAHGDPLAHIPLRVVTGNGTFSHGYWKIPVPPDLRHLTNGATSTGEHRLVMAAHLGRALEPDEVVHHINGDRTDNRIENLELWSTSHPKGQRVDDKLEWALRLVRRYRPEWLNEEAATSHLSEGDVTASHIGKT
jgi:hypothetical protein